MNEKWEMCIIGLKYKMVYSPGVENKKTIFTGKDTWEKERGETIKELLSDGWEPFAAAEATLDKNLSMEKLYFRRRIS